MHPGLAAWRRRRFYEIVISSNPKVVSIRPGVIRQAYLKDLRLSRTMVSGIDKELSEKEARVAECIRRGALVEPGNEEFDMDTLTVRKRKAG